MIEIRTAMPQQDSAAVAELIYDTDRYLFPFLFGARKQALPRLSQLFELNANSFSYRFTHCAVENGVVVGILIGYDPRQIDKEAEEREFQLVLPVFEQWLMLPKYWILKPFLDKSEIQGHYIQNVCVAATHRGRGIGSALIRHYHSVVKTDLWLDVEMGNTSALELYKRLGFRVVREIPILLPGLGSIRMAYQPTA